MTAVEEADNQLTQAKDIVMKRFPELEGCIQEPAALAEYGCNEQH